MTGPARLLAFRLLSAAVRGDVDGEVIVDRSDIEMIPDGTSRQALGQLMAVAALAMRRVAEHEGVTPVDVLADLWPQGAHAADVEAEFGRVDRT